jgi:hypothetical protein
MKVLALLSPLFLASCAAGQASKPDAPAQSCVIVKRHAYKFGENMSRLHPHRPFDYVAGDYPPGFKSRSELSDGDMRELQKKGGRIAILNSDYAPADLEEARKQCKAAASSQTKAEPPTS